MADLIPAHLIPDAMDALLHVHGHGHALVQGRMVTDAQAHHVRLFPTVVVVGMEQKVPGPIGRGHGLLAAIKAVALVDERHLLGNCCHMT